MPQVVGPFAPVAAVLVDRRQRLAVLDGVGAELLEEERRLGLAAVGQHPPGPGENVYRRGSDRLAADDHPVDPLELRLPEGDLRVLRLDREEPRFLDAASCSQLPRWSAAKRQSFRTNWLSGSVL
mgnify:CR=1 FL=1